MNKVYIHEKENENKSILMNQLIQSAEQNQVKLINQPRKADAIVILGNDGDFLHGVRKTNFSSNAVYIGVSENESVGLYSSVPFSRKDDIWKNISNTAYTQKHDVLHLSIDDREDRFYACLNEFSIRSGIIKSIVIDVQIDDSHLEQFHGDGLIVSTPSGSSGYNKSIGGAVVDPKLTSLQISKIAPLTNSRYNVFHSPLVLDHSRKIRFDIIQDGNDHPIIGLDNEAFPISHIRSVELSLVPRALTHFNLPEANYIDQLKDQFLNKK
ncbi:NAD+ kinase [Pelagirhabdus alkalitolerans]|uniref:NAD kinase n=1 Tax=Pelagirhabdus alkalitolerans TaxID=1612202 RepID=A0A1G6HJ43_9BACI|nr:NAD kinase [Pelagirhabdus alkalitolerans]SDB94347.1 NAD+ kinase [Pelagirhabdus alkalitolerans]